MSDKVIVLRRSRKPVIGFLADRRRSRRQIAGHRSNNLLIQARQQPKGGVGAMRVTLGRLGR